MKTRSTTEFSKTQSGWGEDVHAASPGQVQGNDILYTIGDLARDFGVTLRALRFYEDKGLLAPRREGLTRLYTPADRVRLELILKGKRLGFTLAEIRDMIAAHDRREGNASQLTMTREKCLAQIRHLEAQRDEIEAALGELRNTYESINRMITEGGGRGPETAG